MLRLEQASYLVLFIIELDDFDALVISHELQIFVHAYRLTKMSQFVDLGMLCLANLSWLSRFYIKLF